MLTPELVNTLLDFRRARVWEQFHTVRNVASALSVEAAELFEQMLPRRSPTICGYDHRLHILPTSFTGRGAVTKPTRLQLT